jgi:hypothetical protein
MTKEEFNNAKRSIRFEADAKILTLENVYAFANNTVREGDIINSIKGRIRVESIGFGTPYCRDYPECMYKGRRITSKNVPFKNGYCVTIYQSNIKK